MKDEVKKERGRPNCFIALGTEQTSSGFWSNIFSLFRGNQSLCSTITHLFLFTWVYTMRQ